MNHLCNDLEGFSDSNQRIACPKGWDRDKGALQKKWLTVASAFIMEYIKAGEEREILKQ